MKLGYYLLPGLLLGISGCASTTPDSEVDSVHYSQWAEQQAQQNAEAAPQVAAEPVLAQLDEATPAAAENTSQASQRPSWCRLTSAGYSRWSVPSRYRSRLRW